MASTPTTTKTNNPRGGWFVQTPSKKFNGSTKGIYFRAGKAFIPADHPMGEALAKDLKNDFGYEVQEVEDWRNLPEDAKNRIANGFIDSLMIPTRM